MDIVKENMQRAGVTETDDMDRVRLSYMIHCSDF